MLCAGGFVVKLLTDYMNVFGMSVSNWTTGTGVAPARMESLPSNLLWSKRAVSSLTLVLRQRMFGRGWQLLLAPDVSCGLTFITCFECRCRCPSGIYYPCDVFMFVICRGIRGWYSFHLMLLMMQAVCVRRSRYVVSSATSA